MAIVILTLGINSYFKPDEEKITETEKPDTGG
jgi:hypothetical protein